MTENSRSNLEVNTMDNAFLKVWGKHIFKLEFYTYPNSYE